MQKYELTKETIEVNGRTLYRIRRLSDGLLGGYIESENNLSQEGSCFVYDQAKVSGSAYVCDSARLCDSVEVSGDAFVGGSTWLLGSTLLGGSTIRI